MSKRPPKQGPKQSSAAKPFAPPGAGLRPTVPLPGAAAGFRPTVPLPPVAVAKPRPPSQAEIIEALQVAAGHFEAKRFRHAELIAEKILEFVPKQPDALHLKGLVALDNGKAEEAEQLIADAIKATRAPSANMLVNLGNARREQGKFEGALNAYERALGIDSAYVDAFLERGILRRYQRQTDAALEEFARAIALRPDYALAYVRSVEVQMDVGQFRNALAFCEKAIEKIATPPAVIFALKANINDRLSNLDEAIADAEKALAIDAGNVEAIRVWARAQRRRGADKDTLAEARRRLKTIDTGNLSFDQGRSVHEELAQLCDKEGDIDSAFAEFKRVNEIAAREAVATKIDRLAYLSEVETLIGAATRTHIDAWTSLPPPAPESDQRGAPIFLVGFPRSGTTLLEQILDAHPDLQAIEEKPLLRKMRDAAAEFDSGYPASLRTLTEEERTKLRQVYRAATIEEGGDPAAKFVVDKMPLNMIHAGLIARAFPEAKIIFALRHPADVVLSCFMQNFQLNTSMANFLTLEDAAHLYDRVMTLWLSYRELLPLNVVEVRYENLIRDLRAEVEPVLDFLGLPWNEAQADPAAHALARGTIRTPSYTQVTQPIYASAADRWRRYEKHLAPVLPLLEKHIRHFGYAL